MGQSTGIVLAATGISFANEWVVSDQINFRVPIAGLGVALLFNGVEKLNVQAAKGLASIMLITVLFTPFAGSSPLETLANFGSQSQANQKKKAGK